jgi:aldehyde:ferredoxin oxidoreductase
MSNETTGARYGWQGQILSIHLTKGTSSAYHPPMDLYSDFLGGTDFAARLLYDRIPADADALGPQNVLAIMTGPLTGSNFPGCGRVSICALSPLTRRWGQSSMGGFFGVALKKALWDGILIEGIASTPQYLLIEDEQVQLLPAEDLWGLDTYETESLLRKRHPRSEQICIGPAGENLVSMACIAQRPGNLAGRTGMGAVLGSKKLKAVVVHGSRTLRWSDRGELNQLVIRANEILRTDPEAQMNRKYGTAGLTQGVMMMGDMPVRNWSGEIWQSGANKISGETIVDEILIKRFNCHACTIQCKAEIEVSQEELTVQQGPGPEYESLGSLGTLLRHDNLAGVAKANELCNRYGLDTISTGSTIAWAMEAYENGVLNEEHLNGIELTWGNTEAILQTIQAIAYRQGAVGELLSLGNKKAAQAVGKNSDQYAINVKGLEMAMHHPRVFSGLALTYTQLPQGASHMEGGFTRRGKASLVRWIEDTIESMQKSELLNDLVLCSFTGVGAPMEFLSDLMESATGEHFNEQALRACANRGYLLRYLFNLRAGHDPSHDQLPDRILKQMVAEDGHWADDWPLVTPAYYQVRGFNRDGYPTPETLQQAGLEALIPDVTTAN